MLFASIPLVCGPILGWAIVASVGAGPAPFYLAVLLAWLYHSFTMPASSSFRAPSNAAAGKMTSWERDETLILSPAEASIHAAALTVVPALMYLVTHWPTIVGDSLVHTFEHACSIALLLSFPLVYLCVYAGGGSLWWLPGMHDGHSLAGLRSMALGLSLVLFTAGLEGRVVFHGFGEYVRVPAPWSYALVTAALYGALAAAAAVVTGTVGVKGGIPTAVVGTALVVASCAAAVAVGAPVWLLPAAAAGAWGVSRFYATRSLGDYTLFVCGAVACGGWFLGHNFWSLSVNIDGTPMGELCQLLLLSLAVAASAPGLAAVGCTPSTLGILLCVHSLVFARCEDALHAEAHEDGEPMYPPYLVFVTSAAGMVLAGKLEADGRVPRAFAWLMRCIHGGKLALVLLPGSHSLTPSILVGLAASAPYVVEPGKRRLERMSALRGIAHAGFLAVALLHARFAVFDVVFALSGHRPSDATLFGGLLLSAGVGVTPLVRRHFSHVPLARRLLLLVVASGGMLVALRPPMPWKGEIGFWYDAEHVPDTEPDDVDIYGQRAGPHSGWPCWLLILTVLVGLFVASSPRRARGVAPTPAPVRLLLAAAAGTSFGAYLSLEYFPGSDAALAAPVCAACALMAVFLAFTYFPSATSPARMPYVFVAYLACLAMAHASQSVQSGRAAGPAERIRREEARIGVLGVCAGLTLQAAFALKLKVAAISPAGSDAAPPQGLAGRGRYGGGERYGGVGGGVGGGGDGTKRMGAFAPFAGRRPAHLRGAGGALTQRTMAALSVGWMPAVGNAATLISFLVSVLLGRRVAPGSEHAVFALAPILLLLHEDAALFPSLAGGQRYAPPLAAVVVSLCYSAVTHITRGPVVAAAALQVAARWPWIVKNALALLAAAPCASCMVNYLWNYSRVGGLTLMILAPLNALVVASTDVGAVRLLAVLSLACAAGQYLMQRSVRIAGMRAL